MNNNQQYETHIVYVAAGFWKRLVARIIDNSFFGLFLIIFFMSSITHNHYRSEWDRLIGIFGTIIVIGIANVGPLFWKSGQTLGKKIFGMKIIDLEERDDQWYLIKREIFFSFLLMFSFVMFFTFINSHLLVSMNKTNANLSTGQTILVKTILSFMSFWWIFIIGCGLVMACRKDKKHLADLYSGTMVILIARTHDVRTALAASLKPIPAKPKKEVEYIK